MNDNDRAPSNIAVANREPERKTEMRKPSNAGRKEGARKSPRPSVKR